MNTGGSPGRNPSRSNSIRRRRWPSSPWITGALISAAFLQSPLAGLRADEPVTISKSRLEELERKEAELEKLKRELNKTKGENEALKQQHVEDAARTAKASAQPAKHESPPMASLQPLKDTDTVDAADLANYFHADPTAAAERYRKHHFSVRGEIVAFDKPLLVRPYNITLKTADIDTRVICEINPPEKYTAVYIGKNGSELTGVFKDGQRVSLIKLGDHVLVRGECLGLRGLAVKMVNCELLEPR